MRSPTCKELEWELARRCHVDFMKYVWQRKFDPFVVGFHTKAICSRIDRAIQDFKRGKTTYLAIMCCQGQGKSDMVSRYLPAHFIGEFPDLPVIVTGYSSGLVEGFSSDCQSIVKDERLQEIYPGVTVSKKKQSVDEWWIDNRAGKLYWPGLTGSITGKRGALLVCDDFFSGREEAESETIRDARWNTFTNDFLSRAYTTAIVIVLATPWHVDDFFGRIKRKMAESENFPQFEFLKFPAFSDNYPTGTLFPERYPLSWYEAQRASLGPYGTASLMQCDPVVEHGNMFEVDKIKYYDIPPEGIVWKRGWDLASTEKERIKDDPDYTASILMGVLWTTGAVGPVPIIYIEDFTLDRNAAPQRDEKIKKIAINDGPTSELGIESFGPYKDAADNLEAALFGFRKVTKVHNPGDKVTRASVFEPIFHAGNVYIKKAAWNDELFKFLSEFPGGAHDDPIDAMVVAFAMHKPFVKHVWPSMTGIRTTQLSIHWGKQDERATLHYGAVIMRKDLSLWTLCTLWDDIEGKLYVYDCNTTDEPNVPQLVLWLILHMRLKNYKIDKLLCNERMITAPEETEKTMQVIFRDEFKKNNVMARLNDPVHYDQWGSISQVNKIVNDGMILVNNNCTEALQQFTGWVVDNNRPSPDNNGYCECLCLIVSELKRKNAFRERPKRVDYMSIDKAKSIRENDPIKQGMKA